LIFNIDGFESFTLKTFEITETGVGIDNEKAEQKATDRIVKKVVSFVLSKIKK